MNYWTFNTRFVAELTTLLHRITIFDQLTYCEGRPTWSTCCPVKDILNTRVCVYTFDYYLLQKTSSRNTLVPDYYTLSRFWPLSRSNHQKIEKLIFWNYNVSVHVNISALVLTYPVKVNIRTTVPHNCICIPPVGLQATSAHLDAMWC